jgi:hypothetical protein
VIKNCREDKESLMKIKTFFLLVSGVFLSSFSFSQEMKRSKLIEHLLNNKKSISTINGYANGIIPEQLLPYHLKHEKQYLIKTDSILYAGVNGTGLLYKIQYEGELLNYTRIDSTYFMGSSFYSANFSLQNQLYSFGGYGFWRSNGILRKFNADSREWHVYPMDKELSAYFGSSFFFIDDNKRQLIIGNAVKIEDFRNGGSGYQVQPSPILHVFDFNLKKWNSLGHFTIPLTELPTSIYFNTPWGFFCRPNIAEGYLLKVEENIVFKASEKLVQKLLKLNKSPTFDLFYTIDSTLYYGNMAVNDLDSLKFSFSDFIPTNDPVYIKNEPGFSSRLRTAAFFLLAFIALTFVLFLFKNRFKKNVPGFSKDALENTIDREPDLQQNISASFSHLEEEIISMLLDKAKQGGTLSVFDLNKKLGISSKHLSVQKKIRSDFINRIILQWRIFTNSEHQLIIRKRLESDKRSFEYYLNPAELSNVKRYFENKVKKNE